MLVGVVTMLLVKKKKKKLETPSKEYIISSPDFMGTPMDMSVSMGLLLLTILK